MKCPSISYPPLVNVFSSKFQSWPPGKGALVMLTRVHQQPCELFFCCVSVEHYVVVASSQAVQAILDITDDLTDHKEETADKFLKHQEYESTRTNEIFKECFSFWMPQQILFSFTQKTNKNHFSMSLESTHFSMNLESNNRRAYLLSKRLQINNVASTMLIMNTNFFHNCRIVNYCCYFKQIISFATSVARLCIITC